MSTLIKEIKEDISIVICGGAGQGIQTVEDILAFVLKASGFNVFGTKEYMSRIRGGSNSTLIRVSDKKVSAFVKRIDVLIPLDKDAIFHLKDRISKDTLIIGEKVKLGADLPIIDVPFIKAAIEIGNAVYSNIIAASVLSALFKINKELLFSYIKHIFEKKDEKVISENFQAVEEGYKIANELEQFIKIDIKPYNKNNLGKEILLNGAEAIAIGSIASGCNFIAAYPMTPSTGIFTFLAQHSHEFPIISEQAEDEISAINMALGAWYAGARALVNTSGGGFDLMTEGISLCGMIESPLVVNIGGRPGPSTGLPTRMAQEDLNLALYSGHGEFPRIILTPGNLYDAFYLTQKAFNLADKYQVPVFILSDQFLVDSYYNLPVFDISNLKIETSFIETKSDYKRYKFTENEISPRGIPSYGEGLVAVDSDEHDESGHITESMDIRSKMVEKRLKKLELIKKEIIPPELFGRENYEILIVGWGSTYSAIKEALEILNRDDVAFLYFKQVYPLHPDTANYIKKAKKSFIIENNATAQFGQLIKLYTGIDIENKILKYNGLPFAVEEIIDYVR